MRGTICAIALSAAAAAGMLLPGRALSADTPRCKLVRIAEWPVRFERGLPVMEGAIDGKKVGILLDTGAFASIVTKAAADKLELTAAPTGDVMYGVGGASRILVTRLDELRIGDAVRRSMRVRVAGEHAIRGVDFILGDDFFRNIDLEFDYAKGVVRLFQPQDCKNASLAYWDTPSIEVPMERESKIVLPVKVNGREARALIDSGASSSVVALSFAARLGITPQSPGVAVAGCSGGIGSDIVTSWVAHFDSIAVGDELIRDPRLRMDDFLSELIYSRNPPPEVILGTDFLRAHRVYVARSQEKVYISYVGGLVFPATPSLACDDRRRNAKEILAEAEETLAKNPQDPKALLDRALVRSRNKDLDGALTDLDALIGLQPNDAVALYTRANIRVMRARYDEALADVDRAMANGMRTAQVHTFRATIRMDKGDNEGALAEYDEALKLDPRHREALRGRGWLGFLLERYEASDRDYTALFATAQTIPHDALWLHLARSHRGLEALSTLQEQLSKLKDGEWPAPILMHYLGKIDRDTLLAAARGSSETRRAVNLCEARFYLAEKVLIADAKAEARDLLEKVAAECPHDQIEYDSAAMELKKLR